jgi:hypothetical protein
MRLIPKNGPRKKKRKNVKEEEEKLFLKCELVGHLMRMGNASPGDNR